MLHLIPMPKFIRVEEDRFPYTAVSLPQVADERLAKALKKLPIAQDGAPMRMHLTGGEGEAYTLSLTKDGVTLTAACEKGAFYGIQTLRQLLDQGALPCLHIEDEPDFSYRGFYHDVTRGKIPTMETFEELIDRMAYCKINVFQIYSEHVLDLKEFKPITRRTGCLTAEELRHIDDLCYENFIEFIPSVATFGHLFELLQLEEYRDLQLAEDYQPKNLFWNERVFHHTLDPLNPKSLALVKSMIDQIIPLFRTDKFNICCDETFDLENGRYRGQDTGKMYTDFVLAIMDYLHEKGKTPMMWSDIMVQHPEYSPAFPKDAYLLTWWYGKGGLDRVDNWLNSLSSTNPSNPHIVCPGTNSWARLVENIDQSSVNIPEMARRGKEYHLTGLMNTNWGDWGTPCPIELCTYGFLLGAENAWNAGSPADDAFDAHADALFYRTQGAVAAMKELSACASEVPWWQFASYHSNCMCPETGKLDVYIPPMGTVEETRRRISKLLDDVRAQRWGWQDCHEAFLVSAEGVLYMADCFAKMGNYPLPRLADAHAWIQRYRALWLKRNKPSELDAVTDILTYMGNL